MKIPGRQAAAAASSVIFQKQNMKEPDDVCSVKLGESFGGKLNNKHTQKMPSMTGEPSWKALVLKPERFCMFYKGMVNTLFLCGQQYAGISYY